jgi:ketosteroid isomerase-like protein
LTKFGSRKINAMKSTAFILTFLLVARVLCAGEPTASTSDASSEKDTLVQIEHDWGNALLKADVAAWSRYLGDDWVLTYSDGTLVTKPMALADLKEGALRIESFQLDDVKVRVYGDAAVVTGLITEKSKFRDKDTSGARRFTDVFVKRDGRWQAVASHESDVSVPK